MSDDVRISADELNRRMEAGEEFTIVDVRNSHAWGEAMDKAAGAIRVSMDDAEQLLPRIPRARPIVAYCT